MILLVEDHADTCDMMMRLLKRAGYDASCAATAADALSALNALPVRLAIIDYTCRTTTGSGSSIR